MHSPAVSQLRRRPAARSCHSRFRWGLSGPKQGFDNNYNFPGGFYLTSGPIITADWKAGSGDRWTVPLGGGAGKIVRFGRLPVNLQLQAFYNVVTPDNYADWQLRFQYQFLFPK
ncbi:MAG: hypothetical protein WAM73_05295 [Desulfobacterales bacterium]